MIYQRPRRTRPTATPAASRSTPAQPTVVFIHGAQNDHSVWALQTRYFAHHGFNVLAVDLPGHGRSAGPALASVEAMADWLLAVLDAAGVANGDAGRAQHGIADRAGSVASWRRKRVSAPGHARHHLSDEGRLTHCSKRRRNDEPSAIDMVNIWSHSSMAQKPSCPGPGF